MFQEPQTIRSQWAKENLMRRPTLRQRIEAYDRGILTEEETISLFQELVNSSLVWEMETHYLDKALSLWEKRLVKI
jgi:hypothetical protein